MDKYAQLRHLDAVSVGIDLLRAHIAGGQAPPEPTSGWTAVYGHVHMRPYLKAYAHPDPRVVKKMEEFCRDLQVDQNYIPRFEHKAA